jgi:hypothetical protein
MARRHARYSGVHDMARRRARYSGDPTPSSGLIILYYPNRGSGVPSNFYRGPRGPSFSMKGFPPYFTGVPRDFCSGIDGFPLFCTLVSWLWRVSGFIFCRYFAAGREEACRVPPNLCRGPRLTRQGSLHFPHGSPGSGVCLGVFFAGISLLVGRKRVGFPPIFAGGVCLGVFFCRYFAAGREEACRVPPNLCKGPRLMRQGSLNDDNVES